jgi:hypothetical protein
MSGLTETRKSETRKPEKRKQRPGAGFPENIADIIGRFTVTLALEHAQDQEGEFNHCLGESA